MVTVSLIPDLTSEPSSSSLETTAVLTLEHELRLTVFIGVEAEISHFKLGPCTKAGATMPSGCTAQPLGREQKMSHQRRIRTHVRRRRMKGHKQAWNMLVMVMEAL